tara:strand:- start:51 stop:632 length:582 start_codon:yes stop_codon:yes gene_type:complete
MLLKRYDLVYDNDNLSYFVSILDLDYFNGEWDFPKTIDRDKLLIKISNKNLKYVDFANFLKQNQKKRKVVSYDKLISDAYKRFINYNVLELYKNNLEMENNDYKFIIKEYREGLLLFNLMQDKIWIFKDSDSVNLKTFFNNNKSNYLSFQEDRGKIIGDFQEFQEKQWIHSLKLKHKVILNPKTIRRLKRKYN